VAGSAAGFLPQPSHNLYRIGHQPRPRSPHSFPGRETTPVAGGAGSDITVDGHAELSDQVDKAILSPSIRPQAGGATLSLTFEEAVQSLESAPARSQVVPVRITAHGEEGTVLYGYGGLLYEAPEPKFLYVGGSDLILSRPDSYKFEGGRLTTENLLTNARVRLLNNLAYDPKISDDWFPPTFQSFLIKRPEAASIQIGWASRREGGKTQRRLILRVARGQLAAYTVVDIELDERGALLTGVGALSASTQAVWTVSLLDPIPWGGNEIG
jgi:hypothetical protein